MLPIVCLHHAALGDMVPGLHMTLTRQDRWWFEEMWRVLIAVFPVEIIVHNHAALRSHPAALKVRSRQPVFGIPTCLLCLLLALLRLSPACSAHPYTRIVYRVFSAQAPRCSGNDRDKARGKYVGGEGRDIRCSAHHCLQGSGEEPVPLQADSRRPK